MKELDETNSMPTVLLFFFFLNSSLLKGCGLLGQQNHKDLSHWEIVCALTISVLNILYIKLMYDLKLSVSNEMGSSS